MLIHIISFLGVPSPPPNVLSALPLPSLSPPASAIPLSYPDPSSPPFPLSPLSPTIPSAAPSSPLSLLPLQQLLSSFRLDVPEEDGAPVPPAAPIVPVSDSAEGVMQGGGGARAVRGSEPTGHGKKPWCQ